MDNYIFKGLMFPVFDLPSNISLLQRYPQLSQWPEFRLPTKHDINIVIRYIIAAYDKNGMRVYESNALKRKKLAAELAGWKPERNGEFREEVKEILNGDNDAINQMIVRYCKLQRGASYSVLVGMEEVFYGILQKMIGKVEISAKEAQMFEEYEKKIELRAIEFLNGDTSKPLREGLFEIIEFEKLELRPEDIAEKIKLNKDPIKIHPYGDDYNAGKRRVIIEE